MCSTAEKPTPGDRQPPLGHAVRVNDLLLAPRRRKGPLLEQIRDLALEGHSCREIGARLMLGKSTVHRWLGELRRDNRRKVADAGEMIANAVARYDSIYRAAMDAWRNSKMDKEVRFVEDSEAPSGSKKKKSVRTEGRAGDVAFLTKAREAVDAICKLLPRGAQRPSKAEASNRVPLALDDVTENDLSNMSDEELRSVVAHYTAEIERAKQPGEPLPPESTEGTNRDCAKKLGRGGQHA